MTGWQCPVCGGGVAPAVERCPCVAVGNAVSPTLTHPEVVSFPTLWPDTPKQSTVIAPSDDGWIEWRGGTCPVSKRTKVSIRTRDGSEEVGTAYDFYWEGYGHDCDIIAYKVLP